MKKLLIAVILIAVLVMSIGTAFASAPAVGGGDSDTPITSYPWGDGGDGNNTGNGGETTDTGCKGGAPVMALALAMGAVLIGKRK